MDDSGYRPGTLATAFDGPESGATDRWVRLLRPAMKERGVLLPPNQFESQFLGAAHTEADVERTLEAYKHALA